LRSSPRQEFPLFLKSGFFPWRVVRGFCFFMPRNCLRRVSAIFKSEDYVFLTTSLNRTFPKVSPREILATPREATLPVAIMSCTGPLQEGVPNRAILTPDCSFDSGPPFHAEILLLSYHSPKRTHAAKVLDSLMSHYSQSPQGFTLKLDFLSCGFLQFFPSPLPSSLVVVFLFPLCSKQL